MSISVFTPLKDGSIARQDVIDEEPTEGPRLKKFVCIRENNESFVTYAFTKVEAMMNCANAGCGKPWYVIEDRRRA